MKSVLFVCTGNIFRSVTAEYALRSKLDNDRIIVSSAGTNHSPNARIRDDVAAYLASKSLYTNGHQRRTVTSQVLGQADLVVAMSTNHQVILRDKFGTHATLFTQACGGPPAAIPDVDDLFAPAEHSSAAAQQHIYNVIDQIIELTPKLVEQLHRAQ